MIGKQLVNFVFMYIYAIADKVSLITAFRCGLQCFLLRMHQPDGSFIMHDDGETDIRFVRCSTSDCLMNNDQWDIYIVY